MKDLHKQKKSPAPSAVKKLTFGDLVAATYDELGERGARRILQMAMKSHLIRFSRPRCIVNTGASVAIPI